MAHGTGPRSPAWRGALVAALVEVGVAPILVAVAIGSEAANAALIAAAAAITLALTLALGLLLRALQAAPRRLAPWILPPLAILPIAPLLVTPQAPWPVSVAPVLAVVWAVRLLSSAIAPPAIDEGEAAPLARRLAGLFATITAAALLLVAGAALGRGGGATPTLAQLVVGLVATPVTIGLGALTGGLVGAILGRDVAGTAAALASNREHPQRLIRVTRDDRIGALQAGLEALRLRLLDELARHEEGIAHVREAAAARSEFIGALSREVQAATAAIDGELAALQATPAAAAEEEALAAARVAFDGLGALVRELVDLALIETDALRLTIVAVDLRALVDEILAAHQDDARRRGLHLRRSGASELPRVPADAARLQQILDAVITSAIEIAAPAVVQAELRLLDELATVTVTARDQEGAGIGLCEALEGLCEGRRASRGERDLELARALARAHGGDLRIQSGGERVILTLSLPLHPPEEPGDAEAPRPSHRAGDRPRRRLTPAGRAA